MEEDVRFRRPSAFSRGDADEEEPIEPEDAAERLIAQWRSRIDQGEPVDPEAEIRAHPDLAERLRAGFAALQVLDRRYAAEAKADEPPAARLVGRNLGGWRLESALGSGGMGTVYRAFDAAGGDRTAVALKVIHPHLFDRKGFFRRFLREAEIGRRIRHPNVVRTLDADECVDGSECHRFLVMEYVEGRTLRAALAEAGKLPEALCRHVGCEVASALAAIHAAGAVHRDVKPDNVLLTNDHVVKLMDLGVARLTDEAVRLSQSGMFVGSLLYAAPEQLRGQGEVDGRADLHALGLLLYELVTGVHPFQHDDFRVVLRRIADETPRRSAELDPQISPFFEELIAQLLEKDREKRPASAADVARILDQGEESAWWRARSQAIRATTKRPLRRIRIPRETALYGREAELAKLRALYEKAKSGDGQVVLVAGEAGIGKSRLVDEFVGQLAQSGEDVNYLFGGYPPGGAATASGAFSTAYREHLGDDEGAVREALPQTPLLVPAFAALLRGDAAPAGSEALTKDSVQTVFVHATRQFAAQRPTVVLIDDLHFAPHEGRALFASLALAVPGHRILLVGTTRPGIDENWLAQMGRHDQTTHLVVPRLGPKDLVRLLADTLRSEHLAEDVAGRIGAKSDGNPFFVFEILRGLREGQFLTRRSDGTWITTQVLRDIQVPSSVTDLVQARISDLGADDRNALEVASCIGFEWDPTLVAAVLGIPRVPLLQRLGRIEKTHRIVRSAGRRFVFDHHQIQESLYAGLSELLREEYHAGIGEALEARDGAAARPPEARDGALCVDLAGHFLKGSQGSRALRYLDPALTHLERGYLNDAAVRLADRALAAPGLLAGKGRCHVVLRRASRLGLLGEHDEARKSLEEANALADAAADATLRADARNSMGGHLWEVARYDEAQSVLRQAIAIAREIGDRRIEASATGTLGVLLLSVGRYDEARAHIERQLAIAGEIGNRSGEATATGHLGLLLDSLGRHDEARARCERQLAIACEIGDRRGEATATGNLGILFRSLGRYDEARANHERQLTIARLIGDRRSEGGATAGLGNVSASLGRCDEACAHYGRSLAITREMGDRRGEAITMGNLGLVFQWLGRYDAARAHNERALAIAREISHRPGEAVATGNLGLLSHSLGRYGEARAHHERALAIARELGNGGLASEALNELGTVLIVQGLAAEAAAHLREAVALARQRGNVSIELTAKARLATIENDGRATAVAAALAALTAYEASVEANAATEARFLLWQATHDRAHLAEAKRRLDFLVEHAPVDCRESMLTNVRLHREILEAAARYGV